MKEKKIDLLGIFWKGTSTNSNENVSSVQPIPVENTVDANSMGVSSQPVSQPTTPASSIGSQVIGVQASPEIVDQIWNAIISMNIEGPDYIELKQNIKSMSCSGMNLSPEQLMTLAYNVLKGQYKDFNKDVIIKAIDFYINVVEGEKNEFTKQVNEKRNFEIDSVLTTIAADEARLEQIKKEYEELQQKIATKRIEVTNAENDIAYRQKQFEASIDSVLKVLNDDKAQVANMNV